MRLVPVKNNKIFASGFYKFGPAQIIYESV